MRFVGKVLLGIFFVAQSFVATPDPALAKTLNLARSGFWTIYVYMKNDDTFGHCGMKTGSKVGSEVFTLVVSPKGILVFLDDSKWSLKKGDKYDSVTVIADKRWSGNAVVYSRTGVVMSYSFESKFGWYFIKGLEMKFQIGKLRRSLNLSGSGDAIKKLAECTKKFLPSSNPFGPASHQSNPFR